MMAVLAALTMTAFAETSVARLAGSATSLADTAAAGAAQAGLAQSEYDMEQGNFCSALTDQNVTSAAPGVSNSADASYTVTVAYYAKFASPPSGPIACSGGALTGSPQEAVVTSTGSARVGQASATQTETDLVHLAEIQPTFAAFQASNASPVNLNDLWLSVPSGPGSGPAYQGELYTNGPLSGPTASTCEDFEGSIVATGPWTFGTSCSSGSGGPGPGPGPGPAPSPTTAPSQMTVSGSVSIAGQLTLNDANVGGNVTAQGSGSSGNLTISDSTVGGNALASGNIVMCTNPSDGTAACDSTTAGDSYVNGTATAGGSVYFGSAAQEATTAGTTGSCQATTGSAGDTITGCVTPNSTSSVSSPLSYPTLPALTTPAASGRWTEAGYTVVQATSCNGTGAGSVAADAAAATGQQVIEAPTGCALDVTSNVVLQPSATVAIFAPCGVTVGSGGSFTLPSPPPGESYTAQLGLIVPSSAASSSCSSSDGVTISTGTPFQQGGPATVSAFIYTPGTFTSTAKASMTGEVLAETLDPTAPLSIVSSPYSPPGLVFGYTVLVYQHYVSRY